MIFDKKLMFVENEALTGFTGGILGDPIDLGAPRQGDGRAAYIAIVSGAPTTATGEPEITFALETADAANFSDAVTIPLPLPPLRKINLAAGSAWFVHLPLYLKRHIRLKCASTLPLACAGVTAGIVLDPNLPVN
jgi:hypothetical protein